MTSKSFSKKLSGNSLSTQKVPQEDKFMRRLLKNLDLNARTYESKLQTVQTQFETLRDQIKDIETQLGSIEIMIKEELSGNSLSTQKVPKEFKEMKKIEQ